MATLIDIGARKIQHVASSWSFGSNHYPSGQFPKVSIGITVNECPKTGSRQRIEDKLRKTISSQSTAENPNSGIEETVERKMPYNVADKMVSTPTGFPTRSVHADIPIYGAEKSFVNKSIEGDAQKKNDMLTNERRRDKGESGKRMEDVKMQDKVNKGSTIKEHGGMNKFKLDKFNNCDVASREEVAFPTKQATEKEKEADNCNSSALKMKLWEILGNAPSENNQNTDFPIATQESNLVRSKLPSPDPYANKENIDVHQNNELKKGKDSNESKKDISTNEFKNDKNSTEFKKNKNGIEFKKDKNGIEFKKDKSGNEFKEDKSGNEFKKDNSSNELKRSNAGSTIKLKLQQLGENREFKKNLNREFQKAQNKQNSDTIEDDSESPNQVIKRPVTRSLTRRKSSPKILKKSKSNITKKKLSSSSKSDFKHKLEKDNVFAFDEVEAKAGGSDSSSGHYKKSTEKNGEQNNNNYELPKVHFPKSYSVKSMQNSEKKLDSESPNKSSFEFMEKKNASVRKHDIKKCSKMPDDATDSIPNSQKAEKHKFGIPLNNACSPLFQMKSHAWGQQDSPPVHKNVFLHKDHVSYPTMEKKTNRLADDLHSPTFAMYMSPTSPNVLNNENPSTPSTENIKRSKALHNSSPDSCQPDSDASPESYKPDSDAESERVEEDNQASHKTEDKEFPLMGGNHEKRRFSFSQMEEVEEDTESQDGELNGKNHGLPSGFGLTNKWFPSPEKSSENSPISFPKTKRARRLDNAKSSKMMNSPTMPTSSTGGSEGTGIGRSHEDLEQFPEGGLGRCFAQLALALGRFKRRMKSETNKRSFQIMSDAADKIRQQLQDLQSQMLDDVGEFTNASKGKRKHLESKFQEEQATLKLIHEKFREEVNQHLSNCKAVLEEIETHNKELKGSADRQKASHRKLMLQVEEAMEVQLKNAEASIAKVHKDAQKKMTSLKRMLKAYNIGTLVEN